MSNYPPSIPPISPTPKVPLNTAFTGASLGHIILWLVILMIIFSVAFLIVELKDRRPWR